VDDQRRELAFAVHRGDRGVLLDRQVRVALVEKHILEHVVGLGERLVHVAELEGLEAVNVPPLAVALDARLGRCERLLGSEMVLSGRYLTSMSSSASNAVCSSRAITAATGSPT